MSRILRTLPSTAVSLATLVVLAATASSSAPGVPDAAQRTGAPRMLYVYYAPSPGSAESEEPEEPEGSEDSADAPAASAAPEDPDEAVAQALEALPEAAGRYDVAVADLDTGAEAAYGSGEGTFDTASIVKVDILAALLLQAQDTGTPLTAAQERLAAAMIRSSDNAATDTLWWDIGGGPGLAEANRRLGLTATEPGAGGTWGLTQTTASDQLALLDAVYGDGGSALSRDSRRYVEELMTTVVEGQRWGVSAAADDAGAAALKNGWLPRSATGLWDVNSIGRVEHRGHTLLVAVVSDGHASHRAGIDVVETVATTVADTLRN
ncbi:serine hydrolase [Streptomyces sp. 184]|uniref:serine hydrolase n=1 Tax=Streptomyces sp. 184 TaxID=1827526 RepID=UPI0038919B70